MAGTLYVVATPVGNLSDFSERALETLKSVDVILTEDTRVTNKLLMHFGIKVLTLSYHQHSPENRKLEILRYLVDGKSVALVVDAGTPGISDPGNELVDFLLEKEPKIKIVPIPGPSSLTTALSISGFDVSKFVFLGFLPKKKGKLGKLVEKVDGLGVAFAFFESPHRLSKALQVLEEVLGDSRRVFVARELTKMYEESFRGTLSQVRTQIGKSDPRGEVVVVVESIGK